jgi:uncharacterized membrane protein YcaP (DUF421 family)
MYLGFFAHTTLKNQRGHGMLIVFVRTILIYLLLLLAMRLMGKRQIGELEVTDLVITLLLSDIATHPIVDPENPLSHALIPIITLLATEVTLSLLLSRFPRLKNLCSARPNILIRNGRIDQKELERLRISSDELISELRQKDVTSIDDVAYAILEQNGKISVIPRVGSQPPTREDLSVQSEEGGIMHILVSRGVINRYNLRLLGHDEAWLSKELGRRKQTVKDVFLMTVNDNGEIFLAADAAGHTKEQDGRKQA